MLSCKGNPKNVHLSPALPATEYGRAAEFLENLNFPLKLQRFCSTSRLLCSKPSRVFLPERKRATRKRALFLFCRSAGNLDCDAAATYTRALKAPVRAATTVGGSRVMSGKLISNAAQILQTSNEYSRPICLRAAPAYASLTLFPPNFFRISGERCC